jgi:hypothetical protein
MFNCPQDTQNESRFSYKTLRGCSLSFLSRVAEMRNEEDGLERKGIMFFVHSQQPLKLWTHENVKERKL